MENSRDLSTMLLKEIELLEKIPPLQSRIRDAVINREWADYELLMESLGTLGSQFELLDGERVVLFKDLAGGDEPETFYAYTAKLPGQDRKELGELYRKLKMITLQIKIANDSLMEYLREVKTAIAGVLENAYPDRRGKMYSRQGTEREADMRSVVVNRSF
jgi:hypothetical protein